MHDGNNRVFVTCMHCSPFGDIRIFKTTLRIAAYVCGSGTSIYTLLYIRRHGFGK